jgi:hypothetical protein
MDRCEAMIDCAAFEAILDRLLAGSLAPDEERAAEDHAAACERCAELLSIARGEPHTFEEAADEDLTNGILETTSGSPCARAESLLCDWVDGMLQDEEGELLALHLDHCAGCTELSASLATLRVDLPAMAEIEPDQWFVRDVLDATTRRRPSGIAEPALAAVRVVDSWGRRLLERPRLALELAYSGAMVIFLLWGTPVSPLRGTAEKALAIVSVSPAEGVRGAYEGGSYLTGRAVLLARDAWDEAAVPLTRGMKGFWRGIQQKGTKGADFLSVMDRHAGKIWRAVWRWDLVEAGRVLGEAKEEMRSSRRAPAKAPDEKSDRTPRGPAP